MIESLTTSKNKIAFLLLNSYFMWLILPELQEDLFEQTRKLKDI